MARYLQDSQFELSLELRLLLWRHPLISYDIKSDLVENCDQTSLFKGLQLSSQNWGKKSG